MSAWDQHPDRVRPGIRDRRLHRFTGNTIGSFVGLVPSEYSSGNSRVQGSITKTGNTHVRRLWVEAAWHHRARYVVGKTVRDRWELAPAAARARGDEGNRRLHQWWVKFTERRKKNTITNVAGPRAGRLVLVPGSPGRLSPRSASSSTGWWQRVERPAQQL